MKTDEIFRLIGIVVTSIGGTSVIVLGLASWLGKIWSDRIYAGTQAKYEKELEHLRAEITERKDMLLSMQSMMSGSYLASHEKIVSAVEQLWDRVLKLNNQAESFQLIYNITSTRDYEGQDSRNVERVIPPMSREDFIGQVMAIRNGIETVRIFVGERLWTLYQVHYAFCARVVMKAIKEREQHRIYYWDKNTDGTADLRLIELLRAVFEEVELNTIREQNVTMGAPEKIMRTLEIKMVREINELLLGHRLVDLSIEQQRRVEDYLTSLSNKQATGTN